MTDPKAVCAPSAQDIERRFASLPVVLARPVGLTAMACFRTLRGIRWQPQYLERLAALEPPVIFAANHVSHADTGAILQTLPKSMRRRTAVAAALDVFGQSRASVRKAIGRECLQITVAALFHAFAFERHGPPMRSVRTATQLIRNGWSLLLYPEGTRSRNGELGPFKTGVGVIARFTGRPVVPVHVEGGNRVLPCGRCWPGAGTIHVRFGEPMIHDKAEPTEEFVERVRNHVRLLGGVPVSAGSRALESPIIAADVRNQPV